MKTYLKGVGVATLLALSIGSFAEVGTPAGASAQPAAKGDVKRLADGRPDFSGTWEYRELHHVYPTRKPDGTLCVLCQSKESVEAWKFRTGVLEKDRPKYKPEFQAKVADLDKHQVKTDPALRCRNPGLPRIGSPDKIMHRPGEIVFLYDDISGAFWRIVPTDGRAHGDDAEANPLGDSMGRWEGDTLVIETVNFTDDSTWVTDDGSFHTTALKVTERLQLDGDGLNYDVVVEDPQVFAEPWHKVPRRLTRTATELLQPPACAEQSIDHIVDGTHHDNIR